MTDAAPGDAGTPLAIDIISDAVCPWCFIGKRRLEAALCSLPDVPVELRWRPFQLDATIPEGGIPREQYLLRKFGPERVKDMYARLSAVGEEAGIPFAFEKIMRSPNTIDAHRVIRWAAAEGRQGEAVERLFQSYFIEGGDIGDRDLLAQAAGDCGLDAGAIRARLSTDTDVAGVKDEIVAAQRVGVTGVPFFILGGRFAVSGAQPAEQLAMAIEKAARAMFDNAEIENA